MCTSLPITRIILRILSSDHGMERNCRCYLNLLNNYISLNLHFHIFLTIFKACLNWKQPLEATARVEFFIVFEAQAFLFFARLILQLSFFIGTRGKLVGFAPWDWEPPSAAMEDLHIEVSLALYNRANPIAEVKVFGRLACTSVQIDLHKPLIKQFTWCAWCRCLTLAKSFSNLFWYSSTLPVCYNLVNSPKKSRNLIGPYLEWSPSLNSF